MTNKRSKHNYQRGSAEWTNPISIQNMGFTLLEIAISIFILAGSMVTLLSLQSAALERAIRDRQKQQAMLLARSVMAEVELGLLNMPLGEQRFSASEFFSKYSGAFESQGLESSDLERIMIVIVLGNWEYPIVSSNGTENRLKLKRVDLSLSWSDHPRDRINLVYFLPDDGEEDA